MSVLKPAFKAVCLSLVALCPLSGYALLGPVPIPSTPGVPHLTITSPTVRTLVPKGQHIVPEMCQAADSYCLSYAVGKPISNFSKLAADSSGDTYFFDTSDYVLGRVGPGGVVKLVAGRYRTQAHLDTSVPPPVSSPAVNFPFAIVQGIAADLGGNVYVSDSTEALNSATSTVYGSVLRIDPLGVVTRLTGDPAISTTRTDGAAASTQALNPGAISTDPSGNVYVYDSNTCTVGEISATGVMKIVAGTLSGGCTASTSAPATGQQGNTYSVGTVTAMAVGADGTLYLVTSANQTPAVSTLFSVNSSGVITQVAGAGTGNVVAGTVGSGADIGFSVTSLTVDASGNLYLIANDLATFNGFLVEVTSNGSSNQVVTLSKGPGLGAFGIDGAPSHLYKFGSVSSIVLNSFGQLVFMANSQAGDELEYLDRNSAEIFNTTTGVTQKLLTLTNTGTGTLTGLNFGGTGFPFALSPTQAELTANSTPGAPPFSVDQNTGTCLALFGSGTFSLAPNQSCTLAIDYTPNANLPAAGSFTLYTNDPDGPVTASLSAAAVIASGSYTLYFSVSNTSVSPSASVDPNGNFSVNVTVVSNVGSSSTETHTTPSGSVSIGVTNNATGVQTILSSSLQPASSTGAASGFASFQKLPPGTYSLQAVYPGDGTSAPSYSPVQTLYVQSQLINFTTVAVTDYHFPYVGATPQFLNFSDLTYTNPGPILLQDLSAVNTAISNFLTTSSNAAVDTTSAVPLAAGSYMVVPTVPTASSLNYSVTARPATFFIDPANLTVRGNYVNVPYGQYYVPAGVTVPSGGIALNLPLTIYSAPPVLSSDEAASASAPNAITLSAAIDGQPTNAATLLPVGEYTVRPTLSGNGAGNYSLTALPGPVVIEKANLTINAQYTNVRYGQVAGTNYTRSNIIETSAAAAQADVTAGRLTIGTTASGTADTNGYLPVGHYTLTPTVSGTSLANYSVTANRGPLVVQPADLTLDMASYTTLGSMTVTGQNLCYECYTAPNQSLLTTDPALKFNIQITGTNGTSYSNTVPYGSTTPVVLGPGFYSVTPVFTGSGPSSSYSLTLNPGTLTVNFPPI